MWVCIVCLYFQGRGDLLSYEATGIWLTRVHPLAFVLSKWRLHLRRPLACWCHAGSGLAVAAGRAGQGLWWALAPRPALV